MGASESVTFRTLTHGWASATVPHSWQWLLAAGGGERCAWLGLGLGLG